MENLPQHGAKGFIQAKSSDAEILDILHKEAKTAIDNTENIIRKRIDQLGVAQPNVQKLSNGRILVELQVSTTESVLKAAEVNCKLEFWETYFSTEVIGKVFEASAKVGESRNPGYLAKTLQLIQPTQEQAVKNPLLGAFSPNFSIRNAIVGRALVSDTPE